jgi:hypothetical protein
MRLRRRGVGGVLLLVLTSGVLTASAAEPLPRPGSAPSADDVRLALQALRDAGSGRYETRVVRTLPAGTDTNVWTGEYDIRQRASHERLESRTTRVPDVFTAEFVHTVTAHYSQWSSWVAEHGDTWHVFDVPAPPPGWSPRLDYDAAAKSSELRVVLSFRVPDGPVAADEEGDSWVVTGTVPHEYAAPVLTIVGTDGHAEPPNVAGLATARLVLGPDRRVRELRLDGLVFTLTLNETLPRTLYDNLRATTSTIRLSDIGAPVTIRTPPPDRQIHEPLRP